MLPEADYGLTSQAMGAQQGNSAARDTSGMLIKFYLEPHLSKSKSDIEGRPIYEDAEYVSIKAVGTRRDGIIRRATEVDKLRYPEHYAKFKARISNEEAIEGTLLSNWPQITRAMVEEYKFVNIFTVEQLAAVSDTNLTHGMIAMRDKAKKFLETAHINVNAERMADIEAENAEMKRQLAELLAMKDEVKPKRRKRRTKAEIAAALEAEQAEEAPTE